MPVPIVASSPNPQKAIEVLLYVVQHVPNMYNALKVLFFADKLHLARYGRLIYGDSYCAMKHGPVPSLAYDMVKSSRGESTPLAPELARVVRECLTIDRNHRITSRRDPDLSLLSPSDLECLREAIGEYGAMPFNELRAISHRDRAYQAADENDFISLEAIVRSLPEGDELLEYLEIS